MRSLPCCFGKRSNAPAPTVCTVPSWMKILSFVPRRAFATQNLPAENSSMTPASGFPQRQRPWIFQNTSQRIFPFNTKHRKDKPSGVSYFIGSFPGIHPQSEWESPVLLPFAPWIRHSRQPLRNWSSWTRNRQPCRQTVRFFP